MSATEEPIAMQASNVNKEADLDNAGRPIPEKEVTMSGRQSPTLLDPAEENEDEEMYSDDDKPKGTALALILLGLYLATFLFCLDISIVAPAIPKITNDFGSTADATWFFSIYLAINTAFQPIAGPILRVNSKWAFIAFTFIFEVGSLICAVAPSGGVFILGRAIAGLGSAGGFIGVMTIIAQIVPKHAVAQYSNAVGGIYSLGAVAGPLIGGAFTTKVSWRWCFYINLPIGGITLFACTFLLKGPTKLQAPLRIRLKKLVRELDYVGLVLVIGALIMALYVFSYGGIQDSWSSSTMIGLIVGFVLTSAVTVAWIFYNGENSYLRPSLLRNRTILAGMWCNFAIGAAYFTLITLLEYYFQIRGSSALRSGVQLLPLIAGVVASLIVGGALAPVIGYVNPLLGVGMVIFMIFLGVTTLLDRNSSVATWAGLSFGSGFGSGLAFMMPFVMAQAILTPKDLEIGSAMILFPQTLGGALIFGMGQALYQNNFADRVKAIPGLLNAKEVVEGGVTAFRELAAPEFIGQIEVIAIDALHRAFYAPLVCLGLAILVALPLMSWPSVKPPPKEEKADVSKEV
ncbi:hypothetical protein RQP46_005189 [Phenoliferia psychrophenolica]